MIREGVLNIQGNQRGDGGEQRGSRVKTGVGRFEGKWAGLAAGSWCSWKPTRLQGMDGLRPPRRIGF